MNLVQKTGFLKIFMAFLLQESEKLKSLIWMAIDDGLEGLVLKDVDSIYEPGKRHWLKVISEADFNTTTADILLPMFSLSGEKGLPR